MTAWRLSADNAVVAVSALLVDIPSRRRRVLSGYSWVIVRRV